MTAPHPPHRATVRASGLPARPIEDTSPLHRWRRRRACLAAGGHWWHPADAMIEWFCCACGADRDGMPVDGPGPLGRLYLRLRRDQGVRAVPSPAGKNDQATTRAPLPPRPDDAAEDAAREYFGSVYAEAAGHGDPVTAGALVAFRAGWDRATALLEAEVRAIRRAGQEEVGALRRERDEARDRTGPATAGDPAAGRQLLAWLARFERGSRPIDARAVPATTELVDGRRVLTITAATARELGLDVPIGGATMAHLAAVAPVPPRYRDDPPARFRVAAQGLKLGDARLDADPWMDRT